MSGPRIAFKRMVLGLPQGMPNQAAIDAAVDLAEFLEIELLATFVADTTLRALAGLPVARELRTLDQGWQQIDLARLTLDIDRAAIAARQRFAESVRSRTVTTNFHVVAGAEAIASLIRADDLVAIIEPTHPGERITRQFTGLVDAAFDLAAAILVVPRRIVRTSGPVMAMAADPEDASIGVALEIAAALKERLIVATSPGALLSSDIFAEAERLGVAIDQIAVGKPTTSASALAAPSAPVRERLRVVSRSQLSADTPRLFAHLHEVPLLVIEPERAQLTAAGKTDEVR